MTIENMRHGRYLVFLALLLTLPPLLSFFASAGHASAMGFDIAALVFIASSAGHWRDGAPDTIRRQSLRDDGGRFNLLLVTTIILIAVLVVTGSLLERKARLTWFDIGLVVATLVIAWVFANLVYAYHYSKLYYDSDAEGRDRRGLQFPGGDEPCFADFVNFSFVLGMTCQTADIDITSSSLRRVATAHGVIAFFFNLGVLALTINVVASAV